MGGLMAQTKIDDTAFQDWLAGRRAQDMAVRAERMERGRLWLDGFRRRRSLRLLADALDVLHG